MYGVCRRKKKTTKKGKKKKEETATAAPKPGGNYQPPAKEEAVCSVIVIPDNEKVRSNLAAWVQARALRYLVRPKPWGMGKRRYSARVVRAVSPTLKRMQVDKRAGAGEHQDSRRERGKTDRSLLLCLSLYPARCRAVYYGDLTGKESTGR